MKPDKSQRRFCESDAHYLQLLAPAGCGKTNALLHRCLHLSRKKDNEKFLLVTFTKAATQEAESRLATDPDFAPLHDAVTVRTLNAYGFRRMRNEIQHPRLLSSRDARHFAVLNQLRPVWNNDDRLKEALTRYRKGSAVMTVIDDLKTLGFDHTADSSLEKFNEKLDSLWEEGLWPRVEAQADSLIRCRIFDEGLDLEGARDRKKFYNRFFKFWRDAVRRLHEESTFTFEDQKYWCWLDLRSPGPSGREKARIKGVARYAHVLVDEFQDINPLDLALIRTIAARHRASITIVGDDDQAIFEWRGATPNYILEPAKYFGIDFETVTLETNYRSARNIVDHAQKLIQHNKRRVPKTISAMRGAGDARIEIRKEGPIGERLRLVSEIARDIREPGRVAVIGRTRSQLVPYEVYYASDGGSVSTATDLDVFSSEAFGNLTTLLEIWEKRDERQRPQRAVEHAMVLLCLVKKYPFSKKDDANVRTHLQALGKRTTKEVAFEIASYREPRLSGKTPQQLANAAQAFLHSDNVADAIRAIEDGFDGLRFDMEKAEDDIWFTAPPLKQLADMAESEGMSADDLLERLEAAKNQLHHDQFGDEEEEADEGRPLHLMTATRAKGKEFDTVIVLDVNPGMWPYRRAETERELEAERRLFYVAFTRAQKRVILLSVEEAPLSPFVHELELPGTGKGCT